MSRQVCPTCRRVVVLRSDYGVAYCPHCHHQVMGAKMQATKDLGNSLFAIMAILVGMFFMVVLMGGCLVAITH